jgi:ubiquinone/menaquinone biosynthesis C-methylase UbiE
MPFDVDSWFTSGASFWDDVYDFRDLAGEIYRARLETAVACLEARGTLAGRRVLDLGCGAGQLAAGLIARGAQVVAMDGSQEMTRLTRERLGFNAAGHVLRGDAEHLPFPDGSFAVAVGLGLLPWVPSVSAVLTELTRVVAPGGLVLVTFDNSRRLFRLTDPRHTPIVEPVKLLLRLRRRHPTTYRMHTPREALAEIQAAGLRPVWTESVGFGPPTLWASPLGSDDVQLRIHRSLQRRARARNRLLLRRGAHELVLAERTR